jgi:hypothetical protein
MHPNMYDVIQIVVLLHHFLFGLHISDLEECLIIGTLLRILLQYIA